MSKIMTISNRIFFLVLFLLIMAGNGVLSASTMDKSLLDQEKLNSAVGKCLDKNMPWPAGSMRYEIMTRLPDIKKPEGNFSWRIDSKRDENFVGETYLILKLYANGVLFREENIRVRLEILRNFVVSLKNLGKDTIIKDTDIALQKKWVRSISTNSFSSLEEVIGKSVSVGIRPNTELTRNLLREAMAVKRGRMVQIFLVNGPINITATGLSEEDGAEGSFIKVRNISSNKIIYARVIGEAKVKVDF